MRPRTAHFNIVKTRLFRVERQARQEYTHMMELIVKTRLFRVESELKL